MKTCAIALALVSLAACIESPLGSSAGGAGGGGGIPPPDQSAMLPTAGLVSVAAGDGSVQVRWEAEDSLGQPVDVALHASDDKATLFAGPPVHTASGAGAFLLSGLANGVPAYFGLTVEIHGQSVPSGPVLSARPSAITFYVDAASTCGFACGGGLADPFPDVLTAVLVASSFGGSSGPGANVWVRAGTYADIALPLHAGVDLYGGFDAGFDLATRDPLLHPTRLTGQPVITKSAIEVMDGKPGARIDGFEIDGLGALGTGVRVSQSPAQLSQLFIHDCASRGVRVNSLATNVVYDVTLARCDVASSGLEGLQLTGAFDLQIHASRFRLNGLEGVDLDDLVAPDGFPASLRVSDSTFYGNGETGLDCDMGAPPQPGAGSQFTVDVRGSRFERNGWRIGPPLGGCKIDIDYDGFPAWKSEIVLRGCRARDNRGSGFSLDLDSTSSALVHRVLASANGGNGLTVTSESTPALCLVTHSVFGANLGAGVHAAGGATGGNAPPLLASCVLAGNSAGGVSSEARTAIAASSALWLQPLPFGGTAGVIEHFCAQGGDPLAPLFARAPIDYRTALALAQNGALTLDEAAGLALGDTLELSDDGVPRTLSAFSGPASVLLTPAPAALDGPSSCVRFAQAGDVDEDFALALGSAALGAGMPPTSGPAPDAGSFGGPHGGPPGDEPLPRRALFRPGAVAPAPATTVGSAAAVRVAFEGGLLDSLSISAQVGARDSSGSPIALDVAPFLDLGTGELVIPAPTIGWPTGTFTIELFGLRSTADELLVAPIAIPYRAP